MKIKNSNSVQLIMTDVCVDMHLWQWISWKLYPFFIRTSTLFEKAILIDMSEGESAVAADPCNITINKTAGIRPLDGPFHLSIHNEDNYKI